MKEINKTEDKEEAFDSFSAQWWMPYVPELDKTKPTPKWIVESVKIVLKNLLWKNQ